MRRKKNMRERKLNKRVKIPKEHVINIVFFFDSSSFSLAFTTPHRAATPVTISLA